MKRFTHLTRISLLLAFFFALDKIVAFLRSIIIARQFRLSDALDAFNVANNLPDLLFALISGGALAMALIPVLTDTLTRDGRPAAWKLFSRVANLAFVVTGLLAVVIAIFATPIVKAEIGIAPGFGPEQQALIADLMRLNLIATLIFSISGLVMAGLQANQHFLLPAMAPLLYNLGQIFGALVLSPTTPYQIGPVTLPALGLGVHGLVYGVILGAAMHLLIQVPGLVRHGFRWAPVIGLRDRALQQVLAVILPRLPTMFMIQLMFVARDNLASRLGQTGAASSLTYGWMIMQVPETLIGTAIATALLPTLAEHAGRGEWTRFRETLERALQIMLALSLPVAAVMAAGLRPLVGAAFGFDAAGTALLTWTARAHLLTLVGYMAQELMARYYYSRKLAWWPLFSVTLRMAIYLGIGASAVGAFRDLGAPGIALAELAIAAEAALMIAWSNGRALAWFRPWRESRLGKMIGDPAIPEGQRLQAAGSLLRGALAAVLGGGVAYLLALYLPGSALWTALAGMAAGGLLVLPVVQRELRTLFHL